MRSGSSSSWVRKLPCVSSTPLGVPVVPDVKIMHARSSQFPFSSSSSTKFLCSMRYFFPSFTTAEKQVIFTPQASASSLIAPFSSSKTMIVFRCESFSFNESIFFACAGFSAMQTLHSVIERIASKS